MAKLTPDDFQKHLTDQVKEICVERAWNYDDGGHRGRAFQLWCARTYSNYDQGLDTDAEDALIDGHDLGADLVFEDASRKHLVICQCKHVRRGADLVEAEVTDFFRRHELYKDRAWVRKHGSKSAVERLVHYADFLAEEWKVTYCFFSTGKASDRTLQSVDAINAGYEDAKQPVTCALYDFTALKDFYVRSLSLEDSIPESVELQLASGRWVQKDTPHPTVVAIVKGNMLRDLFRRYRESLFSFNIRGYLGDRGINAQIIKTVDEEPDSFYYFNNGVSAICTHLEMDARRNVLIAQKFQVINGAQTVGALGRSDPNSEVEVLLRVTRTLSVSTEKGFNAKIIQFNNSQNAVKLSDFRANDPIQYWIEKQFQELRGKFSKVLPDLVYARKRGFKRGGRATGQGVKLEEVAKIRYAFLHEPTRALESPRDMWTLKADGGVYEDAFGLNGQVVEAWSLDEMHELLFAIALFRFVDEETRKEAAADSGLGSLNRFKYHGLSMAGRLYRAKHAKLGAKALLSSKPAFEKFCEEFWADARRVVVNDYTDAVEDQKITAYGLARSLAAWEKMAKKFDRFARIRMA